MRIVYLGTGDIGLPTFRYLASSHELAAVVTQPDKPAGRALELKPSAIKLAALDLGIPVLQPERIRRPEAIQAIQVYEPEVIVVMAYGQILPGSLLELPTKACLNLHASQLPRHRGAAPIQAAIEAGDRESGITVIYMAEGLDTGDILLTRAVPIRRRETGGSLHDRLALLAPGALGLALDLLERGEAPRVPQEEALATYAPKLTREHGMIDWKASREEIGCKIRAMNPWPGAYTVVPTSDGPKKLKVYTAIEHRKASGEPGEVLRADRDGLLVAAGTGGVLLREVQLEGKKKMSAGQFLAGHRIHPGSRLG